MWLGRVWGAWPRLTDWLGGNYLDALGQTLRLGTREWPNPPTMKAGKGRSVLRKTVAGCRDRGALASRGEDKSTSKR